MGPSSRASTGSTSSSSFARVRRFSRWRGLSPFCVRKGRLIVVSRVLESSIFAFSPPSRIRCIACRSFDTSTPVSDRNSETSHVTRALSMSIPPSCVSPLVEITSNTPSPISISVTSNVPRPRSRTQIFPSPFLSSPYARAAAVGSFTRRWTSRPAILPASLVACLWLSLKYAGTVITACVTLSLRNDSASVLIFRRIIALISCGVYVFPSIVTLKSVPILRLIWITVRSGFRTACRFAGSPTRICPSFVNATTDGNIFPPYVEPSALGMIFGAPPSMYAASEFVVPKSIPMILAILLTLFRILMFHDNDPCGSHDSLPERVALLDELLHLPVRQVVVHEVDALVDVRVEGEPLRGDLLQPGLLQRSHEVLPNHLQAPPLFPLCGLDRRVKVVEHREEVCDEGLVREEDRLFRFPIRALPGVLELRLQVREAGEEVLESFLRVLELPLEPCDVRLRRHRLRGHALRVFVRHGPPHFTGMRHVPSFFSRDTSRTPFLYVALIASVRTGAGMGISR